MGAASPNAGQAMLLNWIGRPPDLPVRGSPCARADWSTPHAGPSGRPCEHDRHSDLWD